MNKSKLELADIFRRHIGDYLKRYRMSKEHYKVVYDILSCRTAYLGGHAEKCDHSGLSVVPTILAAIVIAPNVRA